MIAIDNFKATTTIEDENEKWQPVACTVVGLVRNNDGTFDFIVVTHDGEDRWAATREYVSAPDGREQWPESAHQRP